MLTIIQGDILNLDILINIAQKFKAKKYMETCGDVDSWLPWDSYPFKKYTEYLEKWVIICWS